MTTNQALNQMTTTAPDNPGVEVLSDAATGSTASSAQSPATLNPAHDNALPSAGDSTGLLAEHKGKLAIGVAATLGLMVYYGWREKRLAKSDPQEYARLQRIKAVVRETDPGWRPGAVQKRADRTQPIAIAPGAALSQAPALPEASPAAGAPAAPTPAPAADAG
ncbi:MAG: hypothetical protein NVSMB6_03500 [Burkholderiaceae bacterium]